MSSNWIQSAIRRRGRVRRYLHVKKGEDIPVSKIKTALKNKKISTSLRRALLLALRLKKMRKRRSGSGNKR